MHRNYALQYCSLFADQESSQIRDKSLSLLQKGHMAASRIFDPSCPGIDQHELRSHHFVLSAVELPIRYQDAARYSHGGDLVQLLFDIEVPHRTLDRHTPIHSCEYCIILG